MNFHWTNIISIDNSQNNAFEELVCQLANKESFGNIKEFIKVGNPDGGVECYVVLDNGDEIGFQAKWFLSTLQDAQWAQIEKSLKTTLEKHPNLTKYYISIPLDRADPRIDNQKWFMDKWNEKVERWKTFSKDTYNREIEIIYWGSSELIKRLSQEENGGLKKFFFGELDLSSNWFKNNNELAIKDLGERYTPEINIELEIVENFNALSRNSNFKNQIDDIYHYMMVDFRKLLNRHHIEEVLEISFNALNKYLTKFEKIYFQFNFMNIAKVDFQLIENSISKIKVRVEELFELLHSQNEKEIKEKNIKTESGYRTSTIYDGYISDLRTISDSLNDFKDFLNKPLTNLVNYPYMILDGEAGIGKSHLLADIVSQRLKDGYSSIFLLGQHFRQDKSPWSQILDDILRLKCSENEFLEALNAKAELEQKRIVIFIDAINEGEGKSFWHEFLVSFIEFIKKYKWLGLVISVRSSYKELMIPKSVIEDKTITYIRHYGFEDVEYDATKLFFDYYKIEQPAIPLLHPEFSNPLFLILFCKGLKNKGLTKIPDGYEGISNIIKFFIKGIEDNLVKKYPSIKRLHLLNTILDRLVEEFLDNQVLLYSKAYEIVEEIVSKYRLDCGVLDDLISEGLLTLNMQYNYDTKESYEVVYIVYERFEDHLKVKYLVDTYIDKDNPKKSFKQEPLRSIFDQKNIWNNKGLIEAISIQLPEFSNFELIDVIPQNNILVKTFFESLLWRGGTSISENTVKRILKNIDNENFKKNIFETLFLSASNPNHPLNAKLMHIYLKKFSMKERDVWFIPLLNNIYLDYGINPIKRLIDWAWSDSNKNYLSDESVFLTTLAMSWFLTTSNRKLRDSTTKALISILEGRIGVVIDLLKKFEELNEPYIYERLFAIAFGVVVRTEKNDNLKELGEYIYKTIFDKDEVYPHILLRDYAKNTIDYILYLGIDLDIEYEKVKPPYNSYFPNIEELPTNDEMKKYGDRNTTYNQSAVISSMITEYGYGKGYGGYGDFGRYVFGSALHDFECKKDEQLISNYATKKIFEEYGYDGDFFNKAEKAIIEKNGHSYNRHEHKIERIGKKYQWIAMHDTLARITDNFKMKDPSSWGDEKQYIDYQGSFEPYVRDIDPTILLKETKGSWYIDAKSKYWWNPKENIQWSIENKKWIDDTFDLPNPKNSIFFTDIKEVEWIAIYSSPNWKEPLKKGIDKSEVTHKQLWYIFNSYLIPTTETSEFENWAQNQIFWNNWMPAGKSNYQVFNREFYWSAVYKYFQTPYYGYEDWSEVDNHSSVGRYLHKVGLTTAEYYWESEFDYSKEGSLGMKKPSNILFDGMKMRYAKKEGHFIDDNGELICFDPSTYYKSSPYLMLRKDEFIEFLSKNNLTICWTLIGEKQVITPSFGRDDDVGVMQMSGYMTLDGNGVINIKGSDEAPNDFNKQIKIEDMEL